MTLDDLIGESNALEIFVCRAIMNAYAVSPRRDMTAEYLVLGRYAIGLELGEDMRAIVARHSMRIVR